MQNILITGGAGFIGSHVVRHFVNTYPDYTIVNLDKLTYAGNLESLKDIEDQPNYHFEKVDIVDEEAVKAVFEKYDIDGVVHLAAESHVDRSILDPLTFVKTNVLGTVNLLNIAKNAWGERKDVRFYHVSTDEVYGSLGKSGFFYENTPYDPRSPYSASKASSDHFVRAYYHTYDLPVVLSNCSNNYGPYQFPEKLIPLFITKIVDQEELPVYGKGDNIRDWLWVEDHARAIDTILHKGRLGETYNIGGENEWTNLDLVKLLCKLTDKALGRDDGDAESRIIFIKDRPGHDLRYAIDCTKLKDELGWKPSLQFEEGLQQTIDWYLNSPKWVEHVKSGDYQDYYKEQYVDRLGEA